MIPLTRTNLKIGVAILSSAILVVSSSAYASAPATNSDLDKPRLHAAARLAGDYLVRVQKPDGSFHYWYDPLKDDFSSRNYNILRHSGTTISLFELYAVTKDSRYLDAARGAVRYLKTRLRFAAAGSIYVLDLDGKAKLGANGLALIALAKDLRLPAASSVKGGSEQAAGLAQLILSLERADGALESYYRIRGDEPRGSVSLYYPGEAILGLLSLFSLTKEPRLLDAACRAANHLIESQQAVGKHPPDAWLIQALEALHRIGGETRYGGHAIALAEAMLADQYQSSDGASYAGGFGPGEPRVTPAASRAEGLVAAYRIARATNDPRAARIAEALRASLRFQLSQQYTVANSSSLPNPSRAAGGFRESLSSGRIRIDFVQHNISAFLGAAEALDRINAEMMK